ncbi:MAG: type II toxin-antitoxin system HipA family toxin [Bacteroidales bacterium]|nr:type II toxin-antitoxin system HipA family toxin [Bacteroidales bacterium]
METVVNVKLWNENVAAVAWNKEKEYATIEFYNSFAKNGWDIAPLQMSINDILRGERIFSFPGNRGKTFKGLPALLADSLPDDYGNSVIDEWFAGKNMAVKISPLDRLCYIGKRGMGALEFEPANTDHLLNESSILEIKELTSLAKEILCKRTAFQTNLRNNNKAIFDILRVGTSAGGAKPKAIIAYNQATGEVRSGQVQAPEGFSYWLLKFDGVEGGKIKDNPPGVGKIEYAYYKMAIDCGIEMSESRLLTEGRKAHFMTKRFDRSEKGEKIHTQTLSAIGNFDRDERYSYEQIFEVIRQMNLPYSELEQMYRRMVFNIFARNHDDHTKNHSFIMDKKGKWSLAPAYDLCYSYSPSGKWTNKHQLSLNGKREGFSMQDLLQVAKSQNIKNANEIIKQIFDVVSQWSTYANKCKVRTEFITAIQENLILKI